MTIPKQPSIEERRRWEDIIELASDAGQTLKANPEKGKQAFEELLELYPDDGMVYFQRASAYEAIGKSQLAKMDYEKAKELFPLDRWKWEVKNAMLNLEQANDANGTTAEACRRINELGNIDPQLKKNALDAINKVITEPIDAARDMRTWEEDLVKEIMNKYNHTPFNMLDGNTLDVNINVLKTKKYVPKIVVYHMYTIRDIGNYASHPVPRGEPELEPSDVYPSVAALVAILEWKARSGK